MNKEAMPELKQPAPAKAKQEAKKTETPKKKRSGGLDKKSNKELRSLLNAARIRKDPEAEAKIVSMLSDQNLAVSVEVQVAELETDGYGISKKKAPRFLNRQRISHKQGIALARIQLAMMNRGEKLASGALVSSKERTIARLLELIADEME